MIRVFKCDVCGETVEFTDMRRHPYYHLNNEVVCEGNYVLISGPKIWPKRRKRKKVKD